MEMKKKYIVTGAILGATGVVLGAMAAHALRAVLGADSLDSFNTGVRYQMYHAFFMLVMAWISEKLTTAAANWEQCFSADQYIS